ncbi:hypothetical protein VOLCADRAFT_89088 [Volvox carteri f. nagariensis]|uniref:Carbohydrate binding module family 25 domain-containing protein n=1 Tax=Volvox carteri f. nagariensis TaxID=3068 RepID=D8TQR9_VOLCA|nr:uncharacterized protein VOLCADRAFT_89088 [Volvox carteri f. nagariensis]EFJ50202.1 hypothetical protein VOLCADRAFT_89088 [Volvox carteri f. nagariensis]|eukprot:XP_002948822.1 hypothetical protein VOLCADRAFT_89088 [Volvox carteri f. nagariensis]
MAQLAPSSHCYIRKPSRQASASPSRHACLNCEHRDNRGWAFPKGMQTAPIVVAPPAITPYAPDPGSAGAAGDARVSPSVPAVPAAVPVAAVCTEEDVSKETEGLGRGLPEQSSSAAQFSLSRSSPLAGGRLDVVHWREGRMLRIWTPPGFSPTSSSPSSSRDPLPVLYLNDGQNLYGDQPTLSGCSWHVGEAAAGLINSGALPPFVVVGIDHAGDKRSYDYLPYRPGTANGYRLDAANWPGGGVEAYLRAVVDEILPYTERTYGVSSEPALRGFGGSSFGGICALCAAMLHPGVFGALLVESPSLWFGEERLLRQDLPSFQGPWPARMFLAMGTKEYSGIRKETLTPEFDSRLVSLTHDLAALLESRGLMRGERLQLVIEEGATHTEAAWAGRLPAALSSLGLHWWRHVLSRCRDHLYFTFPRKLLAGRPAVLFFNQARSTALASRPRDSIKMSYGFNVDWSVGGGRIDMTPAVGLTALAAETRVGRATNGTSPLPAYDIVGDVAEAFHAADASSWLQATFTVPPEAYEMHMAFSDGDNGNWDNNDGANFYARVKMDMTAEQRSHTVEQAMAEGPAWGDVQEIAHKRSGSMYFTTPEFLVAGEPAVLYVNRHRVRGLEHSPNMRVHFGFNSWQVGGQEMCLKPSSLWRGEYTDWWSVPLTVPGDATDMSFALTDGHGVWDNNFGNNYMCPVKKARGTGGLVERRVEPRGVESEESMPHAAGTLHIVTLTKRKGGDTAVRANKWTEEKRVRVWTPPGFDPSRPPPGGYPVLYMQDGQNMFEDWLAHQGVSWRVGYTASDLITRGELPPFVVVAVDSVGAMRSLNYLPYPPGTGAGGFRGDAERWPGGGLEAYMGRLVEEIMPLIQQRFAVSSDPAKVAFGGGSFAGVAALYAAMHYPHVFGCVLAESPSLWIAEGRFLQDMRMYRGMLPERLFLGCGTKEYSATRDHDREDVDALLLSYCQEAASILESQGMRGNRLRFLVEEGAGHHELAWQWRLTGAMRFLFSAWWDE